MTPVLRSLRRVIRPAILAGWLFGAWASAAAQSYDILIRGGRLIDGSGTPWLNADIGIRGDRIEAVGRLAHATARQVIDATGLYVAPGFIDAHSHAAAGLARPETAPAEALLRQGVTTVLLNPDGGGPTDLVAQRRGFASGIGVNVAQMIGHNSVRSEVIGNADRAPTPEEQAKMGDLVRRALAAGGFGLSAGPACRRVRFIIRARIPRPRNTWRWRASPRSTTAFISATFATRRTTTSVSWRPWRR